MGYVLKQKLPSEIALLSLGDLVCVEWCDASIGKSLSSGISVDVPCNSWGVFIGILGAKTKHIILAQNNFQYSDGVYDMDYTAIPLQWSTKAAVLIKNYIAKDVAKMMLNSFLTGGRRISSNRVSRGLERSRQMMLRHHEGQV